MRNRLATRRLNLALRRRKEKTCADRLADQQDTRNQYAESERRQNDRSLRRSTVIIAAFTVVLALAAIWSGCTMKGQQVVMQGQLHEMQAERRP